MADNSMRSKAAAMFGKEFMNVMKGGQPSGMQQNAAAALQKRANARPIPTYKDGGKISSRVANRAAMAGYKDGGEAKYKAKLERKMADIEKDYAKAKAKNPDVAKAKYEQRVADAKDDYAKWTKSDRSETSKAEKAAEAALSEARRTKGMSIRARDMAAKGPQISKSEPSDAPKAPSVIEGPGLKPTMGGMPSRKAVKTAAPKVAKPSRKAVKTAVPKVAKPPRPALVKTEAPKPAAGDANMGAFMRAPAAVAPKPTPAAPKMDSRLSAAERLEREAAAKRRLEQGPAGSGSAAWARLKNAVGLGSDADTRLAATYRKLVETEKRRQSAAAAPTFEQKRAAKPPRPALVKTGASKPAAGDANMGAFMRAMGKAPAAVARPGMGGDTNRIAGAMGRAPAAVTAPTFEQKRAAKPPQLKAAADAPGASKMAKDRYRYAVETGMVQLKEGGKPCKLAVGGTGKVRKGCAPIKRKEGGTAKREGISTRPTTPSGRRITIEELNATNRDTGGMSAAQLKATGEAIGRGNRSPKGKMPVKRAKGGAGKVRKGMMTQKGDITKAVKPKKGIGGFM